MTTEPEATEFDVDDPSYRACYVFRPAGISDGADDERPRKKRKIVSEDEPTTVPGWPRLCNGREPQEHTNARQESFRKFWARHESSLQSIAEEVDQTSLNNIVQYLDQPDTNSSKLRTAIVVSGSYGETLQHLLSNQQSAKPHTIYCEIQSTQATNFQTALKSLIRNAIILHGGSKSYTAHLASYKRRIPMAFDLELLQQYMLEKNLNKVILSIPDAETFDLSILSELLSNLTSWKDRIRFVVVLNLATTVSLFESRMSKHTIGLLDTEVFSLSSKKDKLFRLFSRAQLGAPEDDGHGIPVLLGPTVVNNLYEMSLDQSITPYTFTQAIKYCYMTHFFSNSLSALQEDTDHDVDLSVICEGIRNTTSFQKHCTAILDGQFPAVGGETVQKLLNSDSELLQYSQTQLSETYAVLRQSEAGLHVLAIACHHLEPSTTALKQYHQLRATYQRGTLEDSDAYRLITSVLPKLNASSIMNMLEDLTPFVARLHDTSLTELISRPESVDKPDSVIKLLTTLLQSLQPPSPTPFLTEAILITRTQLATNFLPRSRFAISRALASPTDYLGCECCTSNNKATEPTAVLYQLLDEAGREVNVMDLWSTFRDNLLSDPNSALSATPTSKGKGKAKTPTGTTATTAPKSKGKGKKNGTTAGDDSTETTEDHTESKALLQFYTALGELKYLGLVKSTSDRRLNKGVEVLSRVAWHGL